MITVNTYLAYCAGRDQQVRVVRKSELPEELGGRCACYGSSDVLCLDYGAACTGAICPLFEVPTGEMRRRFVEAGLMGAGPSSMPEPPPSSPGSSLADTA